MFIINKIVHFVLSSSILKTKFEKFDIHIYLRLVIDDIIIFHKHLELLQSEIRLMCGASFILWKHSTLNAAMNFFYPSQRSTKGYCSAAWGGLLTCTAMGDRLKRLHRRNLVNLFGQHYIGDKGSFKDTKNLKTRIFVSSKYIHYTLIEMVNN